MSELIELFTYLFKTNLFKRRNICAKQIRYICTPITYFNETTLQNFFRLSPFPLQQMRHRLFWDPFEQASA